MAALIDVDTLHLTIGLVSFSLVLLVVAYPDRHVTTMPRPDLPGPKGFPLLGNLLQVIPWRKRPLVWLKSLHNAYGPVCTFTCPPWGRGILINRPEWLVHVKHGAFQYNSAVREGGGRPSLGLVRGPKSTSTRNACGGRVPKSLHLRPSSALGGGGATGAIEGGNDLVSIVSNRRFGGIC